MIKLKIGRNDYEITKKDLFLDNGSCVQLLTQSKERSDWGNRPNPILSKRAEKELYAYGVIRHLKKQNWTKCDMFYIKVKG